MSGVLADWSPGGRKRLPAPAQAAALNLEAKADQTILEPFDALSTEHTRFVLSAAAHLKRNEKLPEEQWIPIVESMQANLGAIRAAASERLAELETPA